jgi:hypothetical protein
MTDLTARRFGCLLAIERTTKPIILNGVERSAIAYRCRCDCGVEKVILASNLVKTKSCGGKEHQKPQTKFRVMITCMGCGKIFEAHRYRQETRKFCSRACRGNSETVSCSRCGIQVTRQANKLRRYRKVFCSRECMSAWQRENSHDSQRYEAAVIRHRARTYGLSEQQYTRLWKQQRGRCAICHVDLAPGKTKGLSPHIDHCHVTGEVRGILCGPCNFGLGCLRDDPQRIQAAIDYLKLPPMKLPEYLAKLKARNAKLEARANLLELQNKLRDSELQKENLMYEIARAAALGNVGASEFLKELQLEVN